MNDRKNILILGFSCLNELSKLSKIKKGWLLASIFWDVGFSKYNLHDVK